MSFVITLLILVILRRNEIIHITDYELMLISLLTEFIIILYIILGYLINRKGK